VYVLVTDIQKHDSVQAIEDALARISYLQPVQLGPSGRGEASQQVLIESLPPVLVLHLKRFLYDVAAEGIVKISKPVQFAPELQIPPGIIFSCVSPMYDS
jgi:ubiquitin carboxyl-terminal hydrolase 10